MSQDLLDLLALQKIKSDKETAARQMQLQMGQQAAAQGEGPTTIAQQREKEVMELTKNELAQQRGATAQQETTEQQEAMQKLLQGIASAPGAASAAQPKMMATGGIVAFADGGETSPAGRAVRQVVAPFMPGDEERGRLREQVKAKYAGRAGFGGLFKPQSDEQREQAKQIMGRLDSMSTGEMKALLGQEPAISPAYPDESTRGSAANIMAAPPMAPPPAAPPPAAPPPPRPAPAPTGLAGMPGAQGAPSTVPRPAPAPAAPAAPAAPGFEDIVKQGIQGAVSADPMKQGQAYGQSVQDRLMFPEEQERRRKTVEEQRKLYEQEFDPERQRQEKLSRFLLGMSGRRYGELAGGAGAAIDYETSQRGAQRERLKGIEDTEQGLFSLRQGATEKGVASEMERMKGLQQEKTSATAAGVQQLGTEERSETAAANRDAESREKALDRRLEQAKIQISRERNAIDKGVMDYTRLQNSKAEYERIIKAVNDSVDKKFQPLIDAQYMPMAGSDPNKKKQAQQAIRDLETQRDAEVATKTRELREEVNKLSAKQSGSGTGGMPEGFSRVGER
jgi:hypothetical protein